MESVPTFGGRYEAWRKRRYEASFLSRLSDAEAEAAETQVWLEFPVHCGYLSAERGIELSLLYDNILGKIVSLILSPDLPNRITNKD